MRMKEDELYETVQIGAGLGATGRLSDQAIARGLETLTVFEHFLAAGELPPTQVHAVATSAIRDAANGRWRRRLGLGLDGRRNVAARLSRLSLFDDRGRLGRAHGRWQKIGAGHRRRKAGGLGHGIFLGYRFDSGICGARRVRRAGHALCRRSIVRTFARSG